MNTSIRVAGRLLPIALVMSVAVACSNPERAKADYLKSGDAYFEQKKYAEAEVQYRNALQQDPKSGDAHFKLAQTYEQLGDLRNAAREYIRAADALPGNVDAQVRAAVYLLVAEQFEDARARAQKALALDAKNLDAQIILGNSLAGLKDLDGALTVLENTAKLAPSSTGAFVSIGALQLARGNHPEAEAAFRKAVETNPKMAAAHMALANFLWASNRPDEAEASLKQAHQLEPKSVLADRALAGFYIARGRAREAEPYVKALADQDRSPFAPLKLALADYYVSIDRVDDALKVLEPIAATKEGFSAARTRVAMIEYDRRRPAEAQKAIDEVLARDPKNVFALLVNAQFLARQGKIDGAIGQARAATAVQPGSVRAHFLLGTWLRSKGLIDEAISEFNEVLTLEPSATVAQLQLVELNLAKGNSKPALQFAQDAAKAVPNNPVVQLDLARTLLASGDAARAGAVVSALATKYPSASVVHSLSGQVALKNKDLAEARREFSRAEALDGTNFEALSGLVFLDFADKKPAAAKARIDSRLERSPTDARLLALAARVSAAMGDTAQAEQQLRKSIDSDPNYLGSYVALAQIYMGQRRLPDARASLESVIARRPDAIGPQTMVGMLYEAEGNRAEAKKRYERVLKIDPRAGVAANNLAFRYAEDGGNLDTALQLAQTAKERLPDSPEVDDTLGWVYYKKDLAGMAVPLFEAAARKQPGNVEYLYHLGLSALKAGELTKGRKALEEAIRIGSNPAISADAKKALAEL
jgi:putative PEP-CTERM system TPR-repeat lipoprotein